MVPIQTFLILIALLVLSSCSQTSPPHTVTESQKLNQPKQTGTLPNVTTSPTPVEDTTFATSLSSDKLQATITINHLTAKELYQLMAIQATPRSSLITNNSFDKLGSDYGCEQDGDFNFCSFTINLKDGTFKPIPLPTPASLGNPDLAQVQGQLSADLWLADPNTAKKAKIWLLGTMFGDVYENMQDKADDITSTMPKDKSAFEKVGKQIHCRKEVPLSDTTQTWYSCYVYLNVATGFSGFVETDKSLF